MVVSVYSSTASTKESALTTHDAATDKPTHEMAVVDLEETPKSKVSVVESADNLPYSHFTKAEKIRIVVVIAYAGLLAPFSSSSYYPSIHIIARDLDVSLSTINTSVSVFLYAMAVFPLFWSNIAERYGRRNVYIASMLIYTAGSIGCALSKNIASLLVSRLIQSAGSSSVLGVGAGTIADIFERKERGTAMGLYFLGALLGPPLAPIIGGVVGQHLGWRAIFWMLTIMAGVSLLALILFLPETHRRIVAQKHQIRPVNIPEVPTWRENNPIQTLMYARNPIVMAVIFHNAMVFGGYIAMSNSNTFVMSAIYKFTQTKTGLTYLGMGGGCLLGSVLGGRFVDFVLNRERKKLAGESANSEASGGQQIKVPAEIRVRYLWTGAVPFAASTIAYGWMIHAGTVPLGGVLVVQIICGTSLSWQLSFTSNYLIDLYPTRGASITASQAFFRSLWSGVCTQVLINMKTSIGWGWEFTIFGSLVALGLLLTLPITFRGEQLRNRFPI